MSPSWLSRLARGVRGRVSFPLLAKELVETAARRRTYVLRIIYALALYGVFALQLPDETWAVDLNQPYYSALGTGRQMFETLIDLQFFGVVLFLPALMCGRITQEKERDSLVLLFLTELRPWGIILQKYVGGLVPMLSFLLLGLPLAGVAYAFGGFERGLVLRMLLGLFLMSLQIGALALLCSAWCRSTVGAFLSTYVLGALFYAGPPLLGVMAWKLFGGFTQFPGPLAERYLFLLVPPIAIQIHSYSSSPSWVLTVTPSLVSVVFFLALARRFLVRRALTPPSNFLRRLFERIDRLMKRLNRATGDIVFWHDAKSLPADDPVFWRETQRRVLGKPHYLIRLFYLVEIPTVLLCAMVALGGISSGEQSVGLSVLVAALATLAALLLSVQAANSLVSERIGQTLEVLLTTPLSAREIVRQKERALWRLQLVVAAPLLTVFASEAHLEAGFFASVRAGGWVPYLVCAVLLVGIYLPLITWLSLWIGLLVRTRFQAIISALAALTVWVALAPLLFYIVGKNVASQIPEPWSYVVLLSPVSIGFLNEVADGFHYFPWFGSPWPIIVANAALYATIALLIRWRLFNDAEYYLRR